MIGHLATPNIMPAGIVAIIVHLVQEEQAVISGEWEKYPHITEL